MPSPVPDRDTGRWSRRRTSGRGCRECAVFPAAMLAVLLLLVAPVFPGAANTETPSSAPVLLLTADGTRAVTVPDGSPDSLVPLSLEPVHGGVTQTWRLTPEDRGDGEVFVPHNLRSGKVMDVRGYGMGNGDPVQQFRYYGSRNQQWRTEPAGEGLVSLRALHSGKCLSIAAATDDAGNAFPTDARIVSPNDILVQRTCAGAADQGWRLVPNPEAQQPFRLVARHSGLALSLEKDEPDNGINMIQMPVEPSPLQVWTRFSRGRVKGEPAFVIISAHDGKVLDVRGDGTHDRANIQQFSFNGGLNQLWHMWASGDGYWQVVSVGSGKCLDIRGGSRLTRANVQQYACHGGPNQLWRMDAVSLESLETLFPSGSEPAGIRP